MIILDPTAISDASFSRAGPGALYDATGTMVTAAADVLRFTYDPADLAAGARALIEAAATNIALYSCDLDNAYWSKYLCTVTPNAETSVDGSVSMDAIVATSSGSAVVYRTGVANGDRTLSAIFKAGTCITALLSIDSIGSAAFNVVDGTIGIVGGGSAAITALGNARFLCEFKYTETGASSVINIGMSGAVVGDTIYVSHIQVESGSKATSRIVTSGSQVTRAADIVGTTGTVLGSNVPETDAPAYSTGAVYALGDQVVASHQVFQSATGQRAAVTLPIASPGIATWTAHGLTANTPISFATTGALPTGLVAGTVYYVLAPTTNTFNVSATAGGAAINFTGSQSGVHTATAGQNFNRVLSDLSYWTLIGATNQRKMIDQYNNTQTTNAEVIILTFTPRQISQGVYMGGLDADSIAVVVEDPTEGVVYSATESLVISNSASSYFNWFFKRIRRKTYFFTGALPVYYNARVTVTIRRTGGTAKCGMCVIGPLIDIGMSQYGLSTEIKDYSSSTFAFDGTSSTIPRGYAKLMSVDLMIANDQIDYVQEQLADFRQKPVVFVGATMYGSAIVYGKYSSFKNVITYPDYSIMALSTQGTV